MGAVAGCPDAQTNAAGPAAITSNAVGHGQSRRPPDGTLRSVVVRARHHAAVHAAEWILAEHDRIHPADTGRACVGWPDTSELCRVDRMVGGHRSRVERRSDTIRMGWETSTPTTARVSPPPPTWRIRSVHS